MKRILALVTVVFLMTASLPLSAGADAGLSFASIFGDGMVLQQGRPVQVFGFGRDGDTVTVGGLTLTEELRRAAEFAYMSREELLACQEAAVDAAFCGPETKNFLRRALAEFQQS